MSLDQFRKMRERENRLPGTSTRIVTGVARQIPPTDVTTVR